LANSKQALKRAGQAEKRRINNRWQTSTMNTRIKRVLEAIKSGDLEKSREEYRLATSALDKMATKGLIHKNKAARHKSRLNTHLRKLATAAAA
jgi:small subunit ribosomal protein S20